MSARFVAVLVACGVLAIASACFSAAQVALFSLQPGELRALRRRDPRLAAALDALLARPRRLQGVLLLADGFTNLPLLLLCLYALRELRAAPAAPVWLATLLLFGVMVVACDLMPKLAGLARPFPIARLALPWLPSLLGLLERPALFLQAAAERAAARLLPASWRPRAAVEAEEFDTLVRMGEEEGTLQAGESRIIREILRLGDRTVKECMTPRMDLFTLPDDLSNDEAIRRVRQARFRRVPVHAETPDQIVGVLDIRDLLENPGRPYSELLQPPSFVPETMRALDLLRAFQSRHRGLAIVVDEFGGVEGIVTAADLHEEILGDAAPRSDAELYIERLEGERFVVSGDARLDDVAAAVGARIEAPGLDTVGGLVFNRLGQLPRPGDWVEIAGWRLVVRRVARRRIEELWVEPAPGSGGKGEE